MKESDPHPQRPVQLDYSNPGVERQREMDAEYDRRLSLEQIGWPTFSFERAFINLGIAAVVCLVFAWLDQAIGANGLIADAGWIAIVVYLWYSGWRDRFSR
jgi:hypothetical protein